MSRKKSIKNDVTFKVMFLAMRRTVFNEEVTATAIFFPACRDIVMDDDTAPLMLFPADLMTLAEEVVAVVKNLLISFVTVGTVEEIRATILLTRSSRDTTEVTVATRTTILTFAEASDSEEVVVIRTVLPADLIS